MKSAIYIQDGTVQLVLTPETQIDKQVLSALEKAKGLQTFRGSFYECGGGWIRHRALSDPYYGAQSEDSLIFRVNEEKVEEPIIQGMQP